MPKKNNSRFAALKQSSAKRSTKSRKNTKKKDHPVVGFFKRFFGPKASQKTKALSFAAVFGIIGVGFLAVSSASNVNYYAAPSVANPVPSVNAIRVDINAGGRNSTPTPSGFPLITRSNQQFRVKVDCDSPSKCSLNSRSTVITGSRFLVTSDDWNSIKCDARYKITAWQVVRRDGRYQTISPTSSPLTVSTQGCPAAQPAPAPAPQPPTPDPQATAATCIINSAAPNSIPAGRSWDMGLRASLNNNSAASLSYSYRVHRGSGNGPVVTTGNINKLADGNPTGFRVIIPDNQPEGSYLVIAQVKTGNVARTCTRGISFVTPVISNPTPPTPEPREPTVTLTQVRCTGVSVLASGLPRDERDFVINTSAGSTVFSIPDIRFRHFIYRGNNLIKEGSTRTASPSVPNSRPSVGFRHKFEPAGNYRVVAVVEDLRLNRSSTCPEVAVDIAPTPDVRTNSQNEQTQPSSGSSSATDQPTSPQNPSSPQESQQPSGGESSGNSSTNNLEFDRDTTTGTIQENWIDRFLINPLKRLFRIN